MVEPWLWRYDRVIASDPAVARQVLDEMLVQLEAQRWQQRDIFAVHLATEEALVNAINHGNGADADKSVHFVCLLGGDRVRIEITDEGRGFDPAALPDCTNGDHLHVPSGRGVMLMRAFMSRVEFNDRGNAVTMEKERNGADHHSAANGGAEKHAAENHAAEDGGAAKHGADNHADSF
jgi:serine/threonine-protein kinase RsbW